MRVFGLTGGIACGKSTVAQRMRFAHGIPVIDADMVAREVVAPGSDGLAAIERTFGHGVITADGQLDRGAMRRRILADPEAKRTLEAITHPAIFATIGQRLRDLADAGVPLAGVEAAIMVETGSYKAYDELVVVSCSPEIQLRRLMVRSGLSRKEAEAFVGAQMPVADKEKVADVVIRNDADLGALHLQVDALVARWTAKQGAQLS